MTAADAPSISSGDEPAAAPAPAPRTWGRYAAGVLLRLAVRVGLFYLFVCLVLLFFENTLIYPGALRRADSDATVQAVVDATSNYCKRPVEAVTFSVPDGPALSGLFLDAGPNAPAVLICHGNGDHVADVAHHLAFAYETAGASSLVFDYRGYGRSAGTPNEAGVLADARAARSWLAKRCGVAERDVILWGRSLGGGVAIDLAQDGARGLLTESTFTSLPDVAAKKYWMFPVRLMMRNQMNSLEKIGRVTCPTYLIHGDGDSLVPYEHSEQLFAACGAAVKKHITEPGVGHNDTGSEPLVAGRKEFLRLVVHGESPRPAGTEAAASLE